MVHPAAQRTRFLAPGDKLGKYEVIRQIAVGGMAELYLARTVGIEGFEKLVVVKRILPQYAANASFVGMFLNEARLAATLHHPNIAQVYDIGQEDGEYFFAMEYIHGEDLGRLVASAADSGVPISLDVALTLVAGLCAGLHYAHDKVGSDGKPLHVVHRDVSPSNVLVSYDGAVKLVDFGIARAGSQPTTTRGGLKGKIGYMSPEQCRGKETLDRRSDIYSIGALFYELTTGRLPFTDETEYGVLNQIVNVDVPPPSTLVPSYPPALERIVLKALARDREQRYATAIELQGEIEDFAHENRLRISPLVLARIMGSLFPQRLEEWDSARAQGAFFVEQHVLRTLIESGKTGVTGDALEAHRDEDTAITAPLIADNEPTNVQTPIGELHPPVISAAPLSGKMTTPLPLPLRPPAPTPLPPPGVVPIASPYGPGALAGSAGAYGHPAASVGDVTDRVRVATAANRAGNSDTSLLAIAPRSKTPLIVLAVAGALAAAIAAVIVFSGGDPPEAKATAVPAKVAPPPPREPAAVTPAEPAEPAEPAARASSTPAVDAAAEPAAPVVVDEPAPPEPKKRRAARADPKRAKPPAKATRKSEPKSRPEPTPEAKEPAKWNADSPFMPVRPADK